MTQEFLDSLVGLGLAEAHTKCEEAEIKPLFVDKGAHLTSITRPNTAIMELQNRKVVGVAAGDPTELE